MLFFLLHLSLSSTQEHTLYDVITPFGVEGGFHSTVMVDEVSTVYFRSWMIPGTKMTIKIMMLHNSVVV